MLDDSTFEEALESGEEQVAEAYEKARKATPLQRLSTKRHAPRNIYYSPCAQIFSILFK